MQKGFSLLELLIAIGITAGITVVIAQSFITTSKGNIKTELKNSIKQSGDFSLQQIERKIRSAKSINSVCDGSALSTIEITNSDDQITTYGCVESDDTLRIASISAGTTDFLTPTSVSVKGDSCTDANLKLSFTCSRSTGLPEQVSIFYTLKQAGTKVSAYEITSVDFETTVAKRN